MNDSVQLNLALAWIWILFGFLSGMALGMFFHQENWLGGYASFRRRLYRLAHISFFGLGAANLLFYITARILAPSGYLTIASVAFMIGAVAMPICCLLMAHYPQAKPFFALPVISLVSGCTLTLLEVLKL